MTPRTLWQGMFLALAVGVVLAVFLILSLPLRAAAVELYALDTLSTVGLSQNFTKRQFNDAHGRGYSMPSSLSSYPNSRARWKSFSAPSPSPSSWRAKPQA